MNCTFIYGIEKENKNWKDKLTGTLWTVSFMFFVMLFFFYNLPKVFKKEMTHHKIYKAV